MKSTSDELYGSGFMVNNVHAFLHIADDANTYDSSNFSVFLFEHCLASIKPLVRSGKERGYKNMLGFYRPSTDIPMHLNN